MGLTGGFLRDLLDSIPIEKEITSLSKRFRSGILAILHYFFSSRFIRDSSEIHRGSKVLFRCDCFRSKVN